MIERIEIGNAVVLKREAAGCHITAGVEVVMRSDALGTCDYFSLPNPLGRGTKLDARDVVSLTSGDADEAWLAAVEAISDQISDAQRRYMAVANACPPHVMQAIRDKLGLTDGQEAEGAAAGEAGPAQANEGEEG